MANEPIKESDSGSNVVDIGDIRVGRGKTRRPRSSCRHKRVSYDPKERRIWCRDCEQDIDPFDAFVNVVRQIQDARDDLRRRERALREAEQANIVRRAAKALDDVWRSKKLVPICPECSAGLLPEDFARGCGTMIGRELAEAQRRRREMERSGST